MRSGDTGVQLPVNLKRLIWNAQQIFKCRAHRPGPTGASLPLCRQLPLHLCPFVSALHSSCGHVFVKFWV
jgi:hypothetical protein